MPAPVQGAIPRAINAIQSRKGRLGPKERRQAQQKRQEQVKGKLAEQRKNFIKKRNSLRVQIQRAIISEESWSKEKALREKLKRLEDEVGTRLKVPKSAPIEHEEVLSRRNKARDSFRVNFSNLTAKLDKAAGGGSGRIDRRLYDELENKILRLTGKRDSFLWGGDDIKLTKSSWFGITKGQIWDQRARDRRSKRHSDLNRVYNTLWKEANKAAEDGDKKKYQIAEGKILKIISKRGDRLGLTESPTKGSIWMDARLPGVIIAMRKSMDDALSAGDLDRFNKIESKFIRARDKFVSASYVNKNRLITAGGSTMDDRRGEALGRFTGSLKRDMMIAASTKDRRRYNALEKTLLKLDSNAEAGKIWKTYVQGRVADYARDLRAKMASAISANNRKEYNKFERILLRIDPDEKKGRMWRSGKISSYLPTLERKLRKAAIDGDRKLYDKLERVLKRADPDNRPYGGKKGAVWVDVRVDIAAKALKKEMDEAVNANDRVRYDRAEAKLFRMRDKVGLNDPDLSYIGKGEYWEISRKNQAISSLRTTLDKGKREGVENIIIDGNANNFSVTSRVLGNKVELSISPNQTTSFRVNDSYTASDDLSKKEIVAIIREVTRQYGEVMKKMDDDTVFRVSAASGDGREDMRVKAYTMFGFSDPDYDGSMFGVVRNGKVEPSDKEEYYDLRG